MMTSIWGIVISTGILLVVLLPISWLYLNGAFRHHQDYPLTGIPSDDPKFLAAIASMSDSIITKGSAVKFWSDIDAIQTARLELMAQAKRQILFETFKMDPGKRADGFASVLKQKAAEGVTVQVLADSYGAHTLPDTYWNQLQNAGVEVLFFNPWSARAPLDYLRRNHRKLVVVDQQVAMIGGAGISDLWDGRDQHPGEVPWYDFEIEWRGKVVGLLTGFFWQHWLSAGGMVDLQVYEPDLSETSEPSPILITPGEDPSTQDSPIRSLFQLCTLSAKGRLWIASPYLLPDEATTRMLATKQQQGVDVRILTMGPRSDKSYVYYTSRERYGPLLDQGIKVHEYQPSMMHGKMVLIDDQWVSLGSANLDPRSFFHNDELNLCIQSPRLIQEVETFFQTGFSKSQLIQHTDWRSRPFQERMIGRIGNFFYWQF